MPGRIISTPSAAHRCEGVPTPDYRIAGTVWQCDECDKKWVVVIGTQYNETYYTWRPLTEANKNGRDF